ncbi:MAG: hypothetical protein ACKO1F_08740 [Flammeovirgaceae bacterium]
MKTIILTYFVFLLIGTVLTSCESNKINPQINPVTDMSFNGTFRTSNSDNVTGTVTLEISKGYYKSSTNLPFGVGAGKLNVNGSTINFIDTLFFPIPALYGPSYVLSGQHQYDFDGENLKIWRTKNVGEIEYNLKVKK